MGGVRQASSQARQAKLRAAEARRRGLQEIRDAYTRVQAGLQRTTVLARALDETEESYQYQVEEYRRSLINNLEVLQALQILQDARRELIHANYEAKRQYWQLKAIAGEKP